MAAFPLTPFSFKFAGNTPCTRGLTENPNPHAAVDVPILYGDFKHPQAIKCCFEPVVG